MNRFSTVGDTVLVTPDVEYELGLPHPWNAGHNPGGTRGLLLHPAELQRRRLRCEPIVSSLSEHPRDFISTCNVCGSERNAIVAQPDRYGFPSRTAMCLDCGLFFLVDRFTEEGYNEFYRSGMYREISSRFLGERQRITDIQVDQGRYATVLIRALSGYLKFQPGAHILDIGGSAGRIALEFQNLFHAQATILDPAEEEIAAARKLGLNGVVGSVETWYPDEPFDLVLLCRTVEHVLDLRALLARIRTWLRPDGYLYCDIVDFTAACRLVGHPEAVSKIDHCYWLTQESAPNIFRRAGFDIVSINLSLQQPLLGFLLRPAEPVMFPWASVEPDAIQRQLRTIQEIASVWQEYGRTSLDLHDALRRRAYRVKRALTRWVSS